MSSAVQMSPNFKKQPLSSITRDVIAASQFLHELGKEQQDCLKVFARCLPLVEWLREEVKG